MMSAFQRLLQNGRAKPGLSEEVERAVNGLLREAEELRELLRSRRARREGPADAQPINADR